MLVKAELDRHITTSGDTPAVSAELTIATMLQPGQEGEKAQLALLRGVRPEVFLVRRGAYLTAGTWPRAGELLIGRLVAVKTGYAPDALAVGQTLTIEGKEWKISGHFAAPGSTLEAEIWAPLDDLKLHMKRPNDISLVALRLAPGASLNDVKYFCTRHLDLELGASAECDYYASLEKHYAPLRGLAWILVVLVASAGACATINTMYAAVAGRVREFAALQSVGFPRRAILLSLFQESLLLCALATLLASGLAVLLLRGAAVRFTMSAFSLELDPAALLIGGGAGLVLGIVGAIPPAWRAFRLPIADALKAV
jgi:ABC-type antimicrobial peptide transport system permease subunit